MSGFCYPKAMVRSVAFEICIRKSTLKSAIQKMADGADSVKFCDENGNEIVLTRPSQYWVEAYKATCDSDTGRAIWWVKKYPHKVCKNRFSVELQKSSSHAWIEIK